MKTKHSTKKKIFIASSTRVFERGLLNPIIEACKGTDFEPHPWKYEFETGEIIIEDLLRITSESDFAICFFSDDIEIAGDQKLYGTAWNVVLEYGMFLQKLSKERVRIIHYGSSKIPNDLDGIIVGKINSSNEPNIETQIKNATLKILKQWKHIPSLHNDKHGINNVLLNYKTEIDKKINEIDKHKKTNGIKKPLEFYDELLVNLYIKGLENINYKFLTTTYLSSGFWTHENRDIIDANIAMLKRLGKNRGAKRIFLIRRELEEEKIIISNMLIGLKNLKNGETVFREKKNDFLRLKNICKLFDDQYCEIKYAHDSIMAYKYIQEYIKVNDTEIAIYDDFRIDFFDGGEEKKITGLKTFASYHEDFKNLKYNSEAYFNQLWEVGNPINDLLKMIESTFEYYEKKVDYTINKLVDFDHDLHSKDKDLKQAEMAALVNFLYENKYFPNIQSYLDIGSCTGRYLFELKKHLPQSCRIKGFDSDVDCINYMSIKLKFLEASKINVSNITFSQRDFLIDKKRIIEEESKFDLITCMLGTISHFGWDISKSEDFNDSLQESLNQMLSLLTQNGLIIISNWTQVGLDSDLLSFYTQRDLQILKSGTESNIRLKKRLESIGLTVTPIDIESYRLKLFICRRDSLK